MNVEKKNQLIERIKTLEGLTGEERSNLLDLLRTSYGLVWEDRPEEVEEHLREAMPVLIEDKDKALTDGDLDAPNHVLIEGDNLEALTTLAYTHAGKIDVIYIDPPYNTGNKDFIYNDSFVDSEDGYRHSKWLSFMAKRLRIARKLLSDRGVIFISIDDNEQANLKLLCDEVFGENNCRNIINTRRLDKNLSRQFIEKGLQSLAVGCEYVLVYSKTSEVDFFPIMKEASDERKDTGYWKGFWNAADRPTMRYKLLGVKPETGQWKWEKNKASQAVQNYNHYLEEKEKNPLLTLEEFWARTGKTMKFIRRRPENTKGKNKGVEHWVEPSEGILRTSNWSDIITTETHLGFEINFSSPKSIRLISTIIRFASKSNNCTVLDFFAGSGTTLHALMQLNDEDGGHRQCILVTNNENGICENVTYERNKRVIQGYTKPNGDRVEGLHANNLRYYRTDFVPRTQSPHDLRRLVDLSTDMLCIKEDLYSPVEIDCNGKKISKKYARRFQKGDREMIIIYEPKVIPLIVEHIKARDVKHEIKVYVNAPGRYAFDDDFSEVIDKITLCAIPDAILQAYRDVLPKAKDPELPPVNIDEGEIKKALETDSDYSYTDEKGGDQ